MDKPPTWTQLEIRSHCTALHCTCTFPAQISIAPRIVVTFDKTTKTALPLPNYAALPFMTSHCTAMYVFACSFIISMWKRSTETVDWIGLEWIVTLGSRCL